MEEQKTYKNIQNDIERLKGEIKVFEAQIGDLTSQLTHLGRPKGLTWGLAVLAYVAIAGIVVPVWLMPADAAQFTAPQKSLVLGLFASGLLVFFLYLLLIMHQREE